MTHETHKLWKQNFRWARAQLRARFKNSTPAEIDTYFQDLVALVKHNQLKNLDRAAVALLLEGEFVFKNFPPTIKHEIEPSIYRGRSENS